MVSTRVCGTLSSGSNPDRDPFRKRVGLKLNSYSFSVIIYPLIAVVAVYMSYFIYKDKLPVSVIYAFVLDMISNVLFTPISLRFKIIH